MEGYGLPHRTNKTKQGYNIKDAKTHGYLMEKPPPPEKKSIYSYAFHGIQPFSKPRFFREEYSTFVECENFLNCFTWTDTAMRARQRL